MRKYISVGITGGIGSGKSYICEILKTMGYPVFYSDQVAKEIISNDPDAILGIKALFGDEAYKNNELNRPFLADKIFNQPDLREKMNALVHPLVRNAYHKWAEEQTSNLVFNEAAILFETGAFKQYDFTVLITAPIDLKISRLKKRDQSSEEEIKARMNVQWSDEKKIPLANFVVNNDEQEPLLVQLTNIIEEIK